ncbi:MAG TPA: hypothetical protein VI522_07785 [Gammaproteobacteria bacterium]|nr:hypothetical protein [Gammaproteobacteria bacterium]
MVKYLASVFLFLFGFGIAHASAHRAVYFEIDCHTYKVATENDVVSAYRYNKPLQKFEYFQHLSDYAQKIDYSMRTVGAHFLGVTDESGHLVVYRWDYGDEQTPAQFVYWG